MQPPCNSSNAWLKTLTCSSQHSTPLAWSQSTAGGALQGRSYRGTKSTSRSGHTCQRWDAQLPLEHNRTPERFPSAGLTENFCRNPDNGGEVWCYTPDGPEACGVPLCEDEQAPGGGGTPKGGDNGEEIMQGSRMAAVIGAPPPPLFPFDSIQCA